MPQHAHELRLHDERTYGFRGLLHGLLRWRRMGREWGWGPGPWPHSDALKNVAADPAWCGSRFKVRGGLARPK